MDKELKRLNRMELLEVLVRLSEENDRLRKQVEQLEGELAQRQLDIHESGSIAEAALRVNGFFRAAEKAAEQYEQNRRRAADELYAQATRLMEEAGILVPELGLSGDDRLGKLGGPAKPEGSGEEAHGEIAPGAFDAPDASSSTCAPDASSAAAAREAAGAEGAMLAGS